MIHAAPSMIAKGSYCQIQEDKGWAELAEIHAVIFQKLVFKACHFDYPG